MKYLLRLLVIVLVAVTVFTGCASDDPAKAPSTGAPDGNQGGSSSAQGEVTTDADEKEPEKIPVTLGGSVNSMYQDNGTDMTFLNGRAYYFLNDSDMKETTLYSVDLEGKEIRPQFSIQAEFGHASYKNLYGDTIYYVHTYDGANGYTVTDIRRYSEAEGDSLFLSFEDRFTSYFYIDTMLIINDTLVYYMHDAENYYLGAVDLKTGVETELAHQRMEQNTHKSAIDTDGQYVYFYLFARDSMSQHRGFCIYRMPIADLGKGGENMEFVMRLKENEISSSSILFGSGGFYVYTNSPVEGEMPIYVHYAYDALVGSDDPEQGCTSWEPRVIAKDLEYLRSPSGEETLVPNLPSVGDHYYVNGKLVNYYSGYTLVSETENYMDSVIVDKYKAIPDIHFTGENQNKLYFFDIDERMGVQRMSVYQ